MSRNNWIKAIVTIIVLAIIAILAYMRFYPSEEWGVGDLKPSERTYYSNHISDIVETWLATRKDADNYIEAGGLMKESYTTLLVIDTAANAIWIEDDGQIQQDWHTELPANMKWTLYRSTPTGSTELPGRTRLKIRGYYSEYHDGEQFDLVGTGRGWAQLGYSFTAVKKNSYGSYSRPFVPKPYRAGSKRTEKSYSSLVVTGSEYRRYLTSMPPPDPNYSVTQSLLDRNKARFRKVEKRLFRQIGRSVANEGFAVRHISIEPGPDYTAAQANVGIIRRGLVHTYLRGKYCGGIYVRIDRVGNDTWYTRNCTHPRSINRKTPADFNLEFLAHPTGKIPRSKRKALIKKGRALQGSATAAARSYLATLPNETTVELVGICEYPTLGKLWWGPDGVSLERAPCFNASESDASDDSTKKYQFAWRISSAKPRGYKAIITSVQGSFGSYNTLARYVIDRYGNRTFGDLRTETRAFETSRKSTTLSVTIEVADAQSHRIEFENISLVPNQNPGFRIQLQN